MMTWYARRLIALWLTVAVIFTLAALLLAADPVAIKHQGPDTAGNPLAVTLQGPGASNTFQTPVSGSNAGAAASQAATLTGASGKYTYISGCVFSSGGATAGVVVNCTITGCAGGTLTFSYTIPTGTQVSNAPLVITFNPPLQSSATNTNIVCTIPSAGAGNLNQSAAAWGFLQ
jgi:hypothetical protein